MKFKWWSTSSDYPGSDPSKSMRQHRKIIKNRLTVTMKDGIKLSWAFENWTGKTLLTPWLGFYKWLFGRKSEFFRLVHKDGEALFRRSDVRFVSLTREEELQEVASAGVEVSDDVL